MTNVQVGANVAVEVTVGSNKFADPMEALAYRLMRDIKWGEVRIVLFDGLIQTIEEKRIHKRQQKT